MSSFHERLGEAIKDMGVNLAKNSFNKHALEDAVKQKIVSGSRAIEREKRRCFDLVANLIQDQMTQTYIHSILACSSIILFFYIIFYCYFYF